jgi:hypothetical protein
MRIKTVRYFEARPEDLLSGGMSYLAIVLENDWQESVMLERGMFDFKAADALELLARNIRQCRWKDTKK